MKNLIIFLLGIAMLSNFAFADEKTSYTLREAVQYALKNNPAIRQGEYDIKIEAYSINAAMARKMPRVDFKGGLTNYRYASPVTPISGFPEGASGFPEFDRTIYDMGVTFNLPLYMGGRLNREVRIAEIRKEAAVDMFDAGRQELIYNITSIYHKIYQLEKLLEANKASVKQLEAHMDVVELFLKAGTVPVVELLKTEVELAHARQNVIVVRNSLDGVYELLKNLMGIDDVNGKITIKHDLNPDDKYPDFNEAVNRAFSQRPDYQAVLKMQNMAEERVKLAEGKRFPGVYMSGEYYKRSGAGFDFRENWNIGIRFSLPIFDGGLIRAEINREKRIAEKTAEDVRALRLEIIREIKDAYINIENADKRIEVAKKAIEAARENLRIEMLKYEIGAGTSTDVIDARTAMLRAETDYYQAVYDKRMAIVSLRKAVGDDLF